MLTFTCCNSAGLTLGADQDAVAEPTLYSDTSVLAAGNGNSPAGRQRLLRYFAMSGFVVAAPTSLLVAIQLAILVFLHSRMGA